MKFVAILLVSLSAILFNAVRERRETGVQDSIQVERTPAGYLLRFQDPDFNDEWREFTVPTASSLDVSIETTVTNSGAGHWAYRYALKNRSDSRQGVVSFSLQTAFGSQVSLSPFGWSATSDALSVITWTAAEENSIMPGGTQADWWVDSEHLPLVTEADVRGASSMDMTLLDLPKAVQAKVSELERHNTKRVKVLAPGIPTRIIAIGQEGARDPIDVFEDARESYPKWLHEAARDADTRKRTSTQSARASAESNVLWADGVSGRLAEAGKLLETNRSAAHAYLRDWLGVLKRETRDDVWLDAVRLALVVVVEHVVSELR
jgi:hypothetical protein